MLIKVILIYLSLVSYVKNNEVKSYKQSKYLDLSFGSDFAKSFARFKNKVGDFFRLTINESTEKIETKRRKIKKALHNFVDVVFYDKNNSKKNKSALYRRIDFSDDIKISKMSAIQMILHNGFDMQAHTVQTRDGYMLTLHRVLPSNEVHTTRQNIVILHHGLMGSTDDWLLLGPSQALPYLLSEAGYDVWLTNARGSKYSRSHVNLSDNTGEYWDFSFHEIGTFDLPAVIDYIKDNSDNVLKMNFIGFSMGATALLVFLSSLPEYNQVLKSTILLAPLAFMDQIKGPLKLLAEFHGENTRNSLKFLGVNEFMRTETFPCQVIEKYCRGDSRLCYNPLLLMANGGKEIKNQSILQNVLGHLPGGSSAKTIMHYLQLVNSGHFQMYDYGTWANIKKYGRKLPPRYKLEIITLPIVIFSSFDDWLSTNANILRLLTFLPNVIHHVIRQPDFSHTDFFWGEEAPISLFNKLIDMLNLSERTDK